MTVATLLVALYTAWTLHSRHEEVKEAESRAEEKSKQQQAAEDKFAATILQGGVKILSFAADTGEVSAGERVLLCYGVANATRVKIEPQSKPLKPAVSYCLGVFPAETTVYQLTAEDDQGNHANASLTIRVRQQNRDPTEPRP